MDRRAFKARAGAIAVRRAGGESAQAIAVSMGVTRQSVYQLLKSHGYDPKGVKVTRGDMSLEVMHLAVVDSPAVNAEPVVDKGVTT